MVEWTPVTSDLPPMYTDVLIRLKDNPRHRPGFCVLHGQWWVGYQRSYHRDEVSHWRYPVEGLDYFDEEEHA